MKWHVYAGVFPEGSMAGMFMSVVAGPTDLDPAEAAKPPSPKIPLPPFYATFDHHPTDKELDAIQEALDE